MQMRTAVGLALVLTALLGTKARSEDLVNRDNATISEVSSVADQEALRRHFNRGWR